MSRRGALAPLPISARSAVEASAWQRWRRYLFQRSALCFSPQYQKPLPTVSAPASAPPCPIPRTQASSKCRADDLFRTMLPRPGRFPARRVSRCAGAVTSLGACPAMPTHLCAVSRTVDLRCPVVPLHPSCLSANPLNTFSASCCPIPASFPLYGFPAEPTPLLLSPRVPPIYPCASLHRN